MEYRKTISLGVATIGILLMVLYVYAATQLFFPSIYNHVQYPRNFVWLMNLIAWVPCIVCSVGMIFRKSWSLPLSFFMFVYLAISIIIYLARALSWHSYNNNSDLAIWVIIALTLFSLASTFALNVNIKKFFKFPGFVDFKKYLSSHKLSFVVAGIIIISLEFYIVKQYTYFQQYPWPPPGIVNIQIHKKWPFFVKGDIPNQDIEKILNVVNRLENIDKRIFAFVLKDDKSITVITGEMLAPLWGAGNEIELKKVNLIWEVIKVSEWIS